jgi:hypothetical protein
MPIEFKFTLFGEEGVLKFQFRMYTRRSRPASEVVRLDCAKNMSGDSVRMVDQLEARNAELKRRAKFYDEYASEIAHRGPIKGLKRRP